MELETKIDSKQEQPLLSVRNLKMTFVKEKGLFIKRKILIKALDGVSLDIRKSEFVAIVGETGSGKTTLARCILGLTTPDSGHLEYEGHDITRISGKSLRMHRQLVQIVYQDPYESLNPSQDIYRTISTPIKKLLGEKDESHIRDRVANVLTDVGLEPSEVMHRYPHQLSGGQRQRVNIARALAPEPELLIADEPITMLDAEQRMNILSLLRELKERRKLTVLMITHDLASARITSDRIVIMYLGKIVEAGPTSEVIATPHHPYVELVLASAPKVRAGQQQDTSAYDDLPPLDETMYHEKGCVFAPRCKYATQVCTDTEPRFDEISPKRYVACYHPVNPVRDSKTS
ncbi:MAG: ABC transporter ATP-binding protein [Nitrososphaerales archaeon]